MDTDKVIYQTHVADILSISREKKNPYLDLSGQLIGFLPEEFPDLKDFEWVTVLNLEKNFLKFTNVYKYPPNVKVLKLAYNEISTVAAESIPKSITSLDISYNNVVYFDGYKLDNLKELRCSGNKFTNITFPKKITLLHIADCELGSMRGYPELLEEFDGSKNQFNELPPFPSSIKRINLAFNSKLYALPVIPNSATYLNISCCSIPTIYQLPTELKTFLAENADITNFSCQFPVGLEKLNLAENKLSYIPPLPPTLIKANLASNKLHNLQEPMPLALTYLNVSNNLLWRISKELLERKGLVLKHDDNNFNQRPTLPFSGVGNSVGTSPAPSTSTSRIPSYTNHYLSTAYQKNATIPNWTTPNYSAKPVDDPFLILNTKKKYV
jgi:hypothetical protein